MRVLVIMPTYNEAENLESIASVVLEKDQNIDLLIVDDGSPDGTGDIADTLAEKNQRIKVIHREGKLGLGSAYVTGFKYALKNEYDRVIEMDADFSHNPEYLPEMIRLSKEYDVIIGSRYINGVNVVNWPMKRLLLSFYANVYSRIVTGLPVKDCTAGFQCFRKEVLSSIDLDKIRSDGYSFQIEMKYKSWKKGFKLREFPIVFADREKGQSKMSRKIVREAILMVWRLRLMSILGKI
ncbi:polyprenol monophosphomannose synthase [bacterium]|nr:polyprenol monophosphomannose synthase [bacterium]